MSDAEKLEKEYLNILEIDISEYIDKSKLNTHDLYLIFERFNRLDYIFKIQYNNKLTNRQEFEKKILDYKFNYFPIYNVTNNYLNYADGDTIVLYSKINEMEFKLDKNLNNSIIIYVKNEKLIFSINKKIFEILRKTRLNNILSSILKFRENYINYLESKKLFKELETPVSEKQICGIDCASPSFELLEDKFKYFNYQKEDIKWLINMEKKKLFIECIDNTKYNIDNVLISHNGAVLNNKESLKKINYNVKGGCLINEMGLGKTLEMLSLIYFTKTKSCLESENKCNYMYIRGNNNGKFCEKTIKTVSEPYCNVHKKSQFIIKKRTTINYNNENYIKKENQIKKLFAEYINDSKQSYSYLIKKIMNMNDLTVIFCPTHLCDQWVKECHYKFKDLNVMMISTIETFYNIKLYEFIFYDVLIIPYNFLLHKDFLYPKFNALLNKQEKTIKEKLLGETNNGKESDVCNESIKEILNSKIVENILDKKFKRIIVDEFHEINDNIKTQIFILKSEYKWIVTGTPFSSQMNIYKYLQFLLNENESSLIRYIQYYSINSIKNLFRRNTKESIKNEWKEPKIETKVHWLKFTDIEKNIYNSYKEQLKFNGYQKNISKSIIETLLKLCCSNNLIDILKNNKCKTFDEIQDIILNNIKSEITKIEKIITQNKIETEGIQNLLLINPNDHQLKQLLGNFKRNLINKEKELESKKRGLNYLNSIILEFKNKEKWNCSICLSDSDEINNIGITTCGHKFCWDCLLYSVNKRPNCPICKKNLDTNTYFKIENKNESSETNLNELNDLIAQTKSSKVGNIIYFIKNEIQNEKNNKIIVFSQWDSVLKLVGKFLENYKINVVYCEGSIHKRKNSINKFKKDDNVNIIMLSSENAASGLDLIEANKIVMIEPVYGDKQYKDNIENQAIGRVNRIGQNKDIFIHKFLIKDSIEEEIYLNKIETNIF